MEPLARALRKSSRLNDRRISSRLASVSLVQIAVVELPGVGFTGVHRELDEGFDREHRADGPQHQSGQRAVRGDADAGAGPGVADPDIVVGCSGAEAVHLGRHPLLPLQGLAVDNLLPADSGPGACPSRTRKLWV